MLVADDVLGDIVEGEVGQVSLRDEAMLVR